MHDFTPWRSLAGGAVIGLATSLLLILSGRVAGISSIVGGLLLGKRGDRAWRALFIFGLVAAGALFGGLAPLTSQPWPRSWLTLAVAGMLVGVGTRLGSGCTSGHGVCGLSRGSRRSLIAVVTFMMTGAITAMIAGGLS